MTVQGVLFVHPEGYGFVNRSGGQDVFLPPRQMFQSGARDGAYVKAEITEHSPRGPSGRLVEVLGPLPKKFDGILHEKDGQLVVRPDLPELNGGCPPRAVVTNAEHLDASPGDRVKAALRGDDSPVRCKVTNVIDRDAKGAVKRAAIEADMEKRSSTTADEYPTPDTTRRRDLTDRPTVVIDPVGAYDHDDAISIKKDDGEWELGVHIADVAEFAPFDSDLDERARENANTVYLPGMTYPMLPEELTETVSLDGDENLALSVLMSVDESGDVRLKDIVESTVSIDEKLTYSSAHDQLKQDEPPEVLSQLDRVVNARAERRAKHSIVLQVADYQPTLDEDGSVQSLQAPEITPAHRLVEEAMIAANHQVASWLSDHDAPVLYRHHPPPESGAMDELADRFSVSVSGTTPKERFQAIIESVEPGTLDHTFAVSRIKRAMEKAVYQTQPGKHFGLGLDEYAHFTSPIRRYADLLAHYSVKRTLHHDGHDDIQKRMDEAGEHLTSYEETTIELERTVRTICSIFYANNNDVEPCPGVVVDHYNDLSFVQLANGIEGAYHGKIPLGSKQTFSVVDTDLIKREIDLRPLPPDRPAQ